MGVQLNPISWTTALVRTGYRAGDGAVRAITGVVPELKSVREDLRAMRATAERLDRRVADLQQELGHELPDAQAKVAGVQRTATEIATEVEKATKRLPDPDESLVSKIRSRLRGSVSP